MRRRYKRIEMNETIDLKRVLLEEFDRQERALNGAAGSAFFANRKNALADFDRLGFPTAKHEEWKYSNVRNLIAVPYHFNAPHQVTPADIEALAIPNLEGNILYFVNGRYEAALSVIVSPSDQLFIRTLDEALKQEPELVGAYFNKLAKNAEEAFTALNTSFAEHGVFIHVPDGRVVEKPVILRFITDARGGEVGAQPRNVIAVGKNAQVKIAEAFRSIGEAASFTNIVTEIHVGENAHVEYYKVQNESDQAYHIGTTQVRMLEASHFYSATATINGGFIRNNLNIEIDGEHCDAYMYGVYCPDGRQHIDNHTLADHRKPNSVSNELYKGVLRDKSVGVFNGKVFVRQDAQKTNAYQSCKNVVLSPDARMNTKPQLEIFADDVKCSHGTTTGQLDEEALFYMRSRGIPRAEAMGLLMFAFCEDVVSQIRIEPIREYLEGLIAEKLGSVIS